MENLSTCPHCGQKPTISKVFEDVLIECVDHALIAQASTHKEAAAMWQTIVEIRVNSKSLTSEVMS